MVTYHPFLFCLSKSLNLAKFGLVFLLSHAPLSYSADSDVLEQAEAISTVLDTINNAGRSCQFQLDVHGAEGKSSDACVTYLKSVRSKRFSDLANECVQLLSWYNAKREYIKKEAANLVKKPEDAKLLISQMEAIQDACDLDKMKNRKFLKKPLDTMNALSDLAK